MNDHHVNNDLYNIKRVKVCLSVNVNGLEKRHSEERETDQTDVVPLAL